MSETTEKKSTKKLGLSRPGKLELKRTVETGQVRQSFSHGRSKMVTVEVRTKRTFAPDSGGHMAEVRADRGLMGADDPFAPASQGLDADADGRAGSAAVSLTTEEKAVRARALEDARRDDEMPLDIAPADDPLAQEAQAEARVAAEEADRRSAEAARRDSEEEDRKREEQAKASAAAAAAKLQAHEEDEKQADLKLRGRRPVRLEPRRLSPRRGEPRRRAGKLTIAEALRDGDERTRSLASVKRAREKEKQKQQQINLTESQKIIREVIVPEAITVQELANRMSERGGDVIRALMKMDVTATITQTIDADTAELVVGEFGHKVKRVSAADVEIGLKGAEDDAASLQSRAPVVTVMGHVDHGKTTLLDALRETDVASGESGGITQHIGAYRVSTASGASITFIDTPGHEAFTEMRSRGAQVTDIVVLVVAADDSVMPQTVEAIHHAKAAGAPIIVAINKIDRPDTDVDKVRTGLLQHELVVEEMGGEVLSVAVSATEKTNLDKLIETILLQAEILDLKVNPDRAAEGVIIESRIERGRGSVATVLIQRGTLKIGDIFVAGSEWGRVRALIDDAGKKVKQAGPSMPVEVLGLNGTPAAGDDVTVVDSETRAREVTEFRLGKLRDAKAAAGGRGTLEEMFERIKEGEAAEMPMVLKTDVHGSVEAIVGALEKMGTDEVRVNVLHAGVGGINESDVTLAQASGALIIGFNVRANPQAREMSRRDGVEIRYYSIIYEVIDDVRKVLSGMLAPTIRETILGYAKVREVFNITKVGKVAGCGVTEGLVRRGAKVRLLRDDVVIHEGSLSQLKRFKDDAKEVKEGMECGMAFANYQDIQADDVIECFKTEEVAREL